MGHLTFTRRSETSSSALSIKCRNLHCNLYCLKDITEGNNGVCVDFWVYQYAWRVSFLTHDSMIHKVINAFSSSIIVSNHILSIPLFEEPLSFCAVELAAYLFTYVTKCKRKLVSTNILKTCTDLIPSDNILSLYHLCQELHDKVYLLACLEMNTRGSTFIFLTFVFIPHSCFINTVR